MGGNCISQQEKRFDLLIKRLSFNYSQSFSIHPLFGKVKMLTSADDQKFFLKITEFQDQKQFRTLLKSFSENEHQLVAKRILFDNFVIQNMCSKSYILLQVLQFLPISLQTQFKERKTANRPFSDIQLLLISKSVLQILSAFPTKNFVRTQVFFRKGSQLVIYDPAYSQLKSNVQVSRQDLRKIRLSPQQYKSESSSIQSALFSLGLMILMLGNFQNRPISVCQGNCLNRLQIENDLKVFKKQRSVSLYNIVFQCLNFKSYLRPALPLLLSDIYHRLIEQGQISDTRLTKDSILKKKLQVTKATEFPKRNYISEALGFKSQATDTTKYRFRGQIRHRNLIQSRII